MFDIIVFLYELVFGDSGSAACDNLYFVFFGQVHLRRASYRIKNVSTIFVVDIDVNSVAHLIHFNLKIA